MRPLIFVLSAFLPWPLRRRLLNFALRYELHPTCFISRLSFVLPGKLVMNPHSRIGALTVCKGLELIDVGENASIGRLNLITGFPRCQSRHFAQQPDRKPHLIVGREAAITNQHIIDCTDAVTIGAFTTFAGSRSQVLTHSIDLTRNIQWCAPVTIGEYAFVGTHSTILPGSVLPPRSILAAMSLLNKPYDIEGYLYAGVPARPIKPCTKDVAYFTRSEGYVW